MSVLDNHSIICAVRGLFFTNHRNKIMGAKEKSYRGIGGWLIVPLIGLLVTPVRIFVFVYKDLLAIFPAGYWDILTNPGNELYHPLWAPLIIIELVGNFVFILFALALLVFCLNKSRLFPKLMIIFLIVNLLFVAGDAYFADLIPAIAAQSNFAAAKDLTIAGLGALIWVPYFWVSKRVRQTFQN
jgi:Protein of unknown function (DUF2569)